MSEKTDTLILSRTDEWFGGNEYQFKMFKYSFCVYSTELVKNICPPNMTLLLLNTASVFSKQSLTLAKKPPPNRASVLKKQDTCIMFDFTTQILYWVCVNLALGTIYV